MKTLQKNILLPQIATNKGYFLRFYEISPEYPTYKQAWEALEGERMDIGLPERYSSYGSFKVAKCRWNHGKFDGELKFV